MIHEGSCHCGAIRIRFRSQRPLSPRACVCGFCRRHSARTVSDAEGEAEIRIGGALLRYRFAARLADYLICAKCGIYVGAVERIGGHDLATLNLNIFDDPQPELAAVAANYEAETAPAKSARRARLWTPARLITG